MRLGTLSFAVALTTVIGAGNFAEAEVLRVGGTGAATEMLRQLGAKFSDASKIQVEVIPSLGSTGAIDAVADGVLDFAVTSRALKPDERAKGLKQAWALRTPYGLVTSRRNPDGMRTAEVAEVFKAANPRWSDGERIRIILRPIVDSSTGYMNTAFPGMTAATEAARLRPDVSIAATDQDNADLAESLEGSLSGATLTQIKMEKRNLRFVALDGVEPTLRNFEKGIYPFGMPLFVIVSSKKNSAVECFIAFLQSSQGVAALREADILAAVEP